MDDVFSKLANIMKQHTDGMVYASDETDYLYVNTGKTDAHGKDIFFGMVKQANSKVAYHLMPVYCNPALLEGMSPALRKRMQGKSCFHFNKTDAALFSELDALTLSCRQDYVKADKV